MTRPEAPQIADEVNISEAAQLVEQVQQLPEMREDRVEAVRQQIAAGTYETGDKLNAAVERLLDEIG
jgi:anti-sigma28 factor (negative regulator of flagellin synthesis)